MDLGIETIRDLVETLAIVFGLVVVIIAVVDYSLDRRSFPIRVHD